jgi:hypothetical protein
MNDLDYKSPLMAMTNFPLQDAEAGYQAAQRAFAKMRDEPTLYTFSFCLEDCRRIVSALRNEAYQMKLESDRACEKGSREYGTILWEETAILNSIAETIDWGLPE